MFDRLVQALAVVWFACLVGYLAFGIDILNQIDNTAFELFGVVFAALLAWKYVIRRWLRPIGPVEDTTDGIPRALVRRAGAAAAAVVVLHSGRSRWGFAGRSGRGAVPIDRTTRFEIGSVTKVFTALLLADLALDGVLDLDDPLETHLPGFVADPAGHVTLRSLATHTSGLPYVPPSARWLFWLLRPSNPYRGLGRDWLARTARRTRLHDPGAFRYSNLGYMLLGEAITAAAGKPWDQLLHERICTVLGMTATSVTPDANTARGHNHLDLPTSYWALTGLPGVGALYSNVEDLHQFLAAQCDPGATPLGAAIRLTRTPHAPGVGLGWLLTPDDIAWHTGSTGGFGAFVAVRDTDAIAALTNTRHSKRMDSLAFAALRRLRL